MIASPSFSPDPAREPSLLRGLAGAFLLVAAATGAGALVARSWGAEPVVLLFIPAVLAAGAFCGTKPALVSAIAAALAYNYFFTAPYHSLLIRRPVDAVTVAVLFAVAFATSQLAARLREQARLAAAHAGRNATIAGFARHLLTCADERDIADAAVARLAEVFGCHAALLTGAGELRLVAGAPVELALAPSDYAAAATALDTGEPAGRGVQRAHLADWQFRPVGTGAAAAVVGLARDDGAPPVIDAQTPLLGSLLDQVALALDRARLERESRQTAALRERDKIRTALLSSIGEDVKPRLNAIAAAARTLKRSGTVDKAVVAEIADEASKLDRYVETLVDVGPDAAPEPIEVGTLSIDLSRRCVRRDGDEVHLTPKEFAVLAELAKHAGQVLTHKHLLRAVWGPAQQDQVDYLRVAIRALRQKLEVSPSQPVLLINEPGVGYRLRTGETEAARTSP